MHQVWSNPVVNVPDGQGEQTWSLTEVPAVVMYVPGPQEVHGVQSTAPGNAKVPGAHDEQTGSFEFEV
jgi:hypothetical protein